MRRIHLDLNAVRDGGGDIRVEAGEHRHVAERKLWDKYMHAYEAAIRHTSRPEAPWYVVPADHKWFARLVVAEAMVEAMEGLRLEFPKVQGAALKQLERVRGALLAEARRRKSK